MSSPIPDPFAAALAGVDPVRTAIDAARVPGGLNGKEAKDLGDDVSSIESALAKQEAAKARDAADRLDAHVHESLAAESVTGDAAARLAGAAGDLVQAVEALP